jgi:ABC-type multidrug transport system permease subunit
MNREAVPLFIGILFPIIFVTVIILYLSGFYDFMDIIVYLRNFNIIYYLVLIPFGFGFLAIILWCRKPKKC